MLAPEARVILNHQAALNRVRTRVEVFARSQWNGMGSWRGPDIDRFVARVVPVVESGQKQIGGLTNAYLASMARLSGLTPPPAKPMKTGKALRGIEPHEVYRRPGNATWYALSEGSSLDEAVRVGGTRLDELVSTDMQMAGVNAAFDALSGDERVVGYMRVINSGNPCELCMLASTQRYTREDLMPIHVT